MKGILAVLLVAVSVTAQAGERGTTDGNALLKGCSAVVKSLDGGGQKVPDAFAMGQCFGMLEGVAGSAQIMERKLPENMRTCIPENYSNGQGARVVVKYLNENPQSLNLPASFLVMISLKTAFPCS
ncbi:Rap1a/Tai family immunity protein [Pseudomonas nicosulfuronedens]